MSDVALSDLFCVFFESVISMYTNVRTEVVTKRYITENTSETFIQAFSSTSLHSWVSVDELVEYFSSKVTNVIDAIAPAKRKIVSGEKKSPWKNATLVKIGKRECRKA